MHSPALPQPAEPGQAPDPGRSRDHLGPAPAAVGSPLPALHPQHPLGSSQPSQSRTWWELMECFFSHGIPQNSAAFHQTPLSQSLVGRFGLPTRRRGAKPLPEQPGWLRDRVLGDSSSSSATFPIRRGRAEQEGESRAYLGQGPTGRVPAPHEGPEIPSSPPPPPPHSLLPPLFSSPLPALPAFPSWQGFPT